MLAIVVGKVVGVGPVADNEELHETQQGVGIAVAGLSLVIDDLLHGPARADIQGFQFNLHTGNTVDKQNDIIAVVAALGIDAQLADDFEVVFAPVLDIHEGEVERSSVIALEIVAGAERFG